MDMFLQTLSLQLLAQVDKPTGMIGFVDKLSRTSTATIGIVVISLTVLRLFLFILQNRISTHKRGLLYYTAKVFNELSDSIIYAFVLVFLLIRPYIGQTFYIPSESMVPTLEVKDIVIGSKFPYLYGDPNQGDIIMFRPPENALDKGIDTIDFIKRAIGAPGDIIEVRDGFLFVNGKRFYEPYLNEPVMNVNFKLVHYKGEYIPVKIDGDYVNIDRRPSLKHDKFYIENLAKQFHMDPLSLSKDLIKAEPCAVPEGFYLPMGDNRNASFDGRGFGLVPKENIYARAECILFPPSRTKSVRQSNGLITD